MDIIQTTLFSFSNFFLSLPFTYFGLTKFGPEDVNAYWQPPGYIFGIAWSILYLLLGIINLRSFLIQDNDKNLYFSIITQGFMEAIMQTIWLFVTSNFHGKRYNFQHVIGLFVMYKLVDFAWNFRGKFLFERERISFYLYFPYMLWIAFAFILNGQIVYKIYLNN